MSKEKWNEKVTRLQDAVNMEHEPDMVPLAPMDETFGVAYAGHTMAECMYDINVMCESQMKLMQDFDLDLGTGVGMYFEGMGPAFDEIDLKLFQWAGQKGGICTDMSTQQYVEKEYMGEDDYPLLFQDMSHYLMTHVMPQILGCAAPIKNLSYQGMFGMGATTGLAQFADPAVLDAYTRLNKAGQIQLQTIQAKVKFEQECLEAGFPLLSKGMTCTAFDLFSDCLRGTLGISEDMVTQPENLHTAIEIFHNASMGMAMTTASMGIAGQYVVVPLHKGIDMFMSDEMYGEFYWPTLKRLIEAIVAAGYTPYIITEGKYYSRLKYLVELPEHKCVLHFTDMDMKVVKDTVGKHNCITGGFNDHLLAVSTPDKIRDEVKRLLDICAPGGGYLFAVDRTIDYMAKPENVEAMCDAVRTYGKY